MDYLEMFCEKGLSSKYENATQFYKVHLPKNKFWPEQRCVHQIFTEDGTDDCRDGNHLKFPESLESVFTLTLIFLNQLEHISDVLKECITDWQTDGWTDGWTDHRRPPGEPSQFSLDSRSFLIIYWSRAYFRCSERIHYGRTDGPTDGLTNGQSLL